MQAARPASRPALVEESFAVAQLAAALSASSAVGQMAARTAAGSDALAELVRARQRAVEAREHLNYEIGARFSRLAMDAGDIRLPPSVDDDIDARIAVLDAELQRRFPAYFELTTAAPVPLADVQAVLAPDEALLVYMFGREHGYVLAVTRSRAALRRLAGAGQAAIEANVRALRRGLDPSAAMSAAALPAFDGRLAYDLHRRLVAPVADVLAGIATLTVVPDGALTSLPLHVLLTEPPAEKARYRDLGWLARAYAVATVPSVGALRALRALVPASRAPQPFIGFGAPELGSPLAAVAARSGVDLSSLPPLPETEGELQQLARALGGGRIVVGREASERRVRALDLQQYQVIAFATHGLVAGELRGLPEPALVLTPSPASAPDDDGLLMASEIARLTLDADWVVLSACNTAAPDGRPGADGLSGLARAFFMAGSRALLVSHWP